MYKVYVAKLKRQNVKPSCVYKVGITGYSDAMKRLTYRGADEPFPISNYFDDIKVMKTIKVPDRVTAESVERYIMEAIAQGKRFHNWYEKDQISGITEMRTWDYDEFQTVCKLMDSYQESPEYLQILKENNANLT